ncbi:hypothetical protein [Clostridium sp. Marseille-P299]|uniref:hypothetical protein n=1 Tax=Clostridium sp. Marseille-P299 TaxID=1805477 RepID=UPI00082BBFBF|nr:hypothetical protein [Clostridium sp. Marseille-P299]
MNIFEDDLLFEDIDFNVYYDENGEPEEILEMEEDRLKNIISTLERQIKMLPEHYNVEIWVEYKRVCKEALQSLYGN